MRHAVGCWITRCSAIHATRSRRLTSQLSVIPASSSLPPCHNRQHVLHHSFATTSSPSLSTLCPSHDRLLARIGKTQATLELGWVVECVTKTPLTRLQRRSAGRGGLAAVLASLSPSQLQSVQSMMAQRADGHPLQYVLGDTTFCSLHLLCRPPTLIPRPETEQMTDFIIHTLRHSLSTDTPYPSSAQWPTSVPFAESGAVHRPSPPASPALASFRVLDACTGSGCIALALAAHLGCTTVGVDVADDAIQLARDNLSHIRSQGVSVPLDRATFVLHDLLSPTTPPPWLSSAPFDLLVSNPPYIPSAELSSLQPEVADHEDPRALIAGSDGLLFYFPLIALGYRLTRPSERGWPELVMEIGSGSQVGQVTEACRRTGFGDVRVYDDHAGKKRWVAARRDRRRKPE